MKRLLRALIVLATSTLVVCGVKGPPRPPVPSVEGAGPPADAGQGPDAGGPPGTSR